MITAEEFVKSNISCSDRPDFERKCELVIKFARLHTEAALKEASDFAITCGDEELADNILEIYPLENIK